MKHNRCEHNNYYEKVYKNLAEFTCFYLFSVGEMVV